MAMINASAIIGEFTQVSHGGINIEVIDIPLAGTPVNGSNVVVADGAPIAIRAKISNGKKVIYIAASALDAADVSKRIELRGGESVALTLNNLNLLWFDAEQNGLDIEVFFEV